MKKKLTLLCFIITQFIVAQGPGCPNVNAGPDQGVDCTTSCTDLTATFLETGETNSYAVTSIPFNPPSNFNGLANPLFVNIDDIWGPIVNLPFDFCFFGQQYDQLVVGANGGISFDVSNANTFNGWAFSQTIPNNTNPSLSEVNIFGAVHDIDPAASNGTHDIAWELKGQAPCRTFIVSYFNVAHFSCNDLKTFQMMVLYEGTNTIEVYILDKPTCLSWNGGNAVIGIQNPAGTIAYVPPGRNTGNWSASVEAWRFTPNGTPNYELTWYDGSNNPIGNTPTINVCPTADETYTAEVIYTNCNGDLIVDTDTVTVTSTVTQDPSFTMTATCDGGTAIVTGDSGGTFAFNPLPGDGAVIDTTTGTVTGGTAGTTYTVEYTTPDGCGVTTQDVTVLSAANPAFTMTATCDGGTATITGDAGGTFAFNPLPGDGAVIDIATGTVTLGTSGTTYTIEYTIPGACGASSTQDVTVLSAANPAFTMTATCDGGTATITGDAGGAFAFNPLPGDGAVIDIATGTVTLGTSGTTYTIEYTIPGACGASSTQDVTVLSAANPAFTMTATCDGGTATITGDAGGAFAFNPLPGDGAVIDIATGTVTLGTSGTTYTIEYTIPGACGASSTQDVTVLSASNPAFTMTATCDGGTTTITGDAGGTFALNPLPGDGAVIDVATGTVTLGTSGTTYTVEYTIPGACGSSSTQDVTALLLDDASFTMIATCDGGTATITGVVGGVFAFNPLPGDGAVIDVANGTVTGGTAGTTYTIEYTTIGACSASSTQDVTVLSAANPAFTTTATCDGGTATITGDAGGAFAFNPLPGDGAVIDIATGTVTGGTSGTTYTIEYTISGSCGASSTQDVTALPAEDASFTMTATCDGGTAVVTGTAGGTFALNPDPGLPVTVDSNGTVTGGTPGVTYTVEYTTSGACFAISTQDVAVLLTEDASFTMTATCDGGTAVITGTAGGTFALNPDPGDGAVINDSSVGTVTGGTPGVTYTVEYTTSGSCFAISTQDVTVLSAANPAFTMTATCDGGTATITGDAGGTFALNPDPGDGAVINDSSVGTVTGGTSGTTYTVEYTISGSCGASSTQDVTVNSLPDIVSPTPLIVCDDSVSDGFTFIDLNIKNNEITAGNTSFSVTYYLTQVDADNGSPQLVIPYLNTSNPQIIFVRVDDVNTACYDTTTLELQVEQAPIAFTPTPLEYCDPDSDGFGVFDLDSTIAEITGGDPDLIVTFHGTMQNAIDGVIALVSPYNNIDAYTQTIFIRVENINSTTDCAAFLELELIIHDIPTIVDPTPLQVCDDDLDGFAQFDLTLSNDEILDGLNPGQYIVSFYETEIDAETPVNAIPNPSTYNNTTPINQIVWVRVEDNLSGCHIITSLELIVNEIPALIDPTPLELCDDDVADEITVFDLTVKDTEITGGNANWVVEYFETDAEAQAGTPAINPSDAYMNTSVNGNPPNPQTIFVRVTNAITGCYSFTTLTLRVNPLPSPGVPLDLVACDDDNDGFYNMFDLDSQTITIINGEPDISITYHDTQEDADNGNNPLASPYTNIVPNVQIIYVRSENAITGCMNTSVLFELHVVPSPIVSPDIPPLEACDDNNDGFTQFNLNDMNSIILGSQNPADFILTYHLTAMNAEDGLNPIVEPNLSNYSNVSNPQTIYVRLESLDNACVSIGEFELIVNFPPEPILPTPLELCDDEVADELTVFDLTVKDEEITGGDVSWTVEYFETSAEAQAGTPAISPADAYTNTSVNGNPPNPQTLFVRVTNSDTGCFAFTTLTIRVLPNPTPTPSEDLASIEQCDDNNSGDLIETFDITINEVLIINGEPGVTPTYYTSLEDAENGENAISNPASFDNTNPTEIIYVRVTNDITGCYTIVFFTIEVIPIPDVNIDDLYTICVNTNGTEVIGDPIIETGLDIADYSFEWTNGAGDIVGLDSSYMPTIDDIGNITVTVTDRITLCSNSDTTIVQLSSPPILSASVITQSFAENNMIEATAVGDAAATFEFSLDNGPWLSNDPHTNSYTFTNVTPGEHLIIARDIYGCGIASTTILVLDYPLYFTPNSDGYNDTWQIVGISNQLDAKIYIFDRYGKLLKQLSPTSSGWDGTLNGSPLPSSDYWFTVDYREPSDDVKKQFKAHFTLKR